MNVAARREQALEEFGKVENLADLLSWVEKAPVRQGGPRLRIKEVFLELGLVIGGKDPIIYLHNLYYEDQKSLDEILAIPEIIKIKFFPKATLSRHLFGKFGWTARPNTDRTPVHEEQLDKKITGEILEFEKQVSNLIGGREEPRVFKMNEFQEKDYKIGKALYILKTLGGIDKQTLYRLSVEGEISNAVLARSLNKELEKILERNPELGIKLEEVELYPQSIDRWFRYNTDRGNNSDK